MIVSTLRPRDVAATRDHVGRMLAALYDRGFVVTRVGFAKYMAILMGAISLGVGISSALDTRAFVAEAVRADGTVIALVRHARSESNAVAPIVRFATVDGETIEFRPDTASDPPSYARGERIGVLYRPLAPRDARVDEFVTLWGSSLLFGALGSVSLGIGVAWVVWSSVLARKVGFVGSRAAQEPARASVASSAQRRTAQRVS